MRMAMLGRAQITPQSVRACRFSQPGKLQIQQQVKFPLAKKVTADSAVHEFLNQLDIGRPL